MRYFELKQLLYIAQTVLGLIFLIAGIVQYNLAGVAAEPVTYILTALSLFVMGTICILFGVEAYLLRDDPDIWR